MNSQSAAKHLLNTIDLPSGAANVFSINAADGECLIVWIDAKYLPNLKNIPTLFEGYKVNIEQRPTIKPN
jgi:hypothetical protein